MDYQKIVKEEMDKMVAEAEKNHDKITNALEKLRKKFIPEIKEMAAHQGSIGKDTCKRVQLSTVANLIDFPIHELMLHFINCYKNAPDSAEFAPVQYHLGNVYFYKKNDE